MALPAFASPFAPELKIISVLIEMGGNVAAFSRLRFFFTFFLVFQGGRDDIICQDIPNGNCSI